MAAIASPSDPVHFHHLVHLIAPKVNEVNKVIGGNMVSVTEAVSGSQNESLMAEGVHFAVHLMSLSIASSLRFLELPSWRLYRFDRLIKAATPQSHRNKINSLATYGAGRRIHVE